MRRPKRKYKSPRHPWQADRIKEENQLLKEYGLKKKQEILRMENYLRNWREQAKTIASLPENRRRAAETILLTKLQKYGILDEKASLDDVLSLNLRDILEKRLQTIVYRKSMSLTVSQARQFIVHNKILVNSQKVNSPSYLVRAADEIAYVPGFIPKIYTKKEEIPRPEVKAEQPKEEIANA